MTSCLCSLFADKLHVFINDARAFGTSDVMLLCAVLFADKLLTTCGIEKMSVEDKDAKHTIVHLELAVDDRIHLARIMRRIRTIQQVFTLVVPLSWKHLRKAMKNFVSKFVFKMNLVSYGLFAHF